VAAGHDEFSVDMVRPYLDYYAKEFKVPVEEIISWGQIDKNNNLSPFSMFGLGLRMSQYCNGVSRLHGEVARKMWINVWPNRQVDEIPISHITNGVHIPSWISIENAMLFERYLAPNWSNMTWKLGNLFERI
jgi:starch phosphorylase